MLIVIEIIDNETLQDIEIQCFIYYTNKDGMPKLEWCEGKVLLLIWKRITFWNWTEWLPHQALQCKKIKWTFVQMKVEPISWSMEVKHQKKKNKLIIDDADVEECDLLKKYISFMTDHWFVLEKCSWIASNTCAENFNLWFQIPAENLWILNDMISH